MTDSNGQAMPYLTTEELAGKLGVSPRTVRRWLAETDVPHRRVGDVIRFVLAEVDTWMKRGADPSEKAEQVAALHALAVSIEKPGEGEGS